MHNNESLTVYNRTPVACAEVFIDSCALDYVYSKPKIHNFFYSSSFNITLSSSLQEEIKRDNTPDFIKEPLKFISWFTEDSPNDNSFIREGIIDLMQGNASSREKHRMDGLHIFSVANVGGYFVTIDKRIIKKRDEISKYLFEQKFNIFSIAITRFIYTPEEFIELCSGSF